MTANLGRKTVPIPFLVLVLSASSLTAAIPNWAAPATWTPPRAHAGLTMMGDKTLPIPFVGSDPCRIADTRGNGFAGQYGPPSLSQGSPRNFTLVGQCAIPAGAAAVSLNVTVTNTQGPGFILIYPAGGAQPTVSTLNYVANQTVANAAVVPLGTGGAITVIAGVSGTDLILDMNGYYTGSINPGEAFLISGSLAGVGVVFGQNASTSTGSSGVRGAETAATGVVYGVDGRTTSTTDGAGGVRGIASASTGMVYGVLGLTSSTDVGPAGVLGESLATTGFGFGVKGQTSSTDGGAGVSGIAIANTGFASGVFGRTLSTSGFGAGVVGDTFLSTTSGVTGVFGTDGAGAAGGNQGGFSSAGVEGDGQNGVIGRASAGNGVSGVTQTTAGLTTYGALGTPTHGVWAFVGDIGCSSCTKAFVDPHPTDPSREVRFVALEGNEAGTYFRGTAETVGREFVIQVPEDFRLVTDSEGLTVQLTPVGELATLAVINQDLNQIVVRSSRDVKFHYLVHGVRATFKNVKTIQEMSDFLPQTPDGRMPQGWAETTKQRLIANGTYNPDGTLNGETAERLGWTKMWAEREEQARAAAAANAAARAAMMGEHVP